MDLLGRYSNPCDQGLPLGELASRSVEGPQPARFRTLHQVQRRLRDGEAAALVADYGGGATVYELARRYQVHRETVVRVLHRHGVTMRYQSLSPMETDEAARLYRSGLSLAATGERLGFSDKAVWTALNKAGVEMRPRQGGKQHDAC